MYGDKLRSVILYGSTARGTAGKDSDVDIMLLIDMEDRELRKFEDRLTDISTEYALKYLKVFSIVDVNYGHFKKWSEILPFYKNVSQEGIVVYES